MVSLHIRHSALQTATWILAICMSEYSSVKIFNFPNLVCFFEESSAGQIKGLSGPDVARGSYFGDPCYNDDCEYIGDVVADAEFVYLQNGDSVLHSAAIFDQLPVIEGLRSAEADINPKNEGAPFSHYRYYYYYYYLLLMSSSSLLFIIIIYYFFI